MIIERRSPRTGQLNRMDLPITQEQLDAWEQNTLLIQQAFPQLTLDQRKFIMTGYTAEDWEAMFPPEEE